MASGDGKPTGSNDVATSKDGSKSKQASASDADAAPSPPRDDSKTVNRKVEGTPTTEPMSPTQSRAAPQADPSGSFQHVLNPYYHYQQGTPPPPSPGTYDIHAMLLQQQAAMGASPYTPAQTYSGAMPPPPPLSPTASNNSTSFANSAVAAGQAAHMVSPLMSPVAYGMGSSMAGAEAIPNSPPLYLGQQAVPNSPATSYSGIYGQYGSSSPSAGAGTAKWAGTAQQDATVASQYPVQYHSQYSLDRSDSVQSVDSASVNDMLNPSTMGQQNPAQAAYSQYAARQMSGGTSTGAPGSWGGYAAGQPYAAAPPISRQQQQYGGQPRAGAYQQAGGRYGGAPTMGGYAPGAPYYAATTPGPPIQTTPSNKGPDGANLFIFHIPNHFTNLDMYNLFCPYGNLLSVRIMVEKDTGRSRGFGFVSYDSPDCAAMAIKELNGFAIGNKRLKVQHKQIRPGEMGAPPSPDVVGGQQQLFGDGYPQDGESSNHGAGGDIHSGGKSGLPATPSVEDGAGDDGANADDNVPSVPTFEQKVGSHQIRSAPTSSNSSPLGQYDAIRNALPETGRS